MSMLQSKLEVRCCIKKSNHRGYFTFPAHAGDAIVFKFSHAQFSSTREFKRISPKYRQDTIRYNFEMEFMRTKTYGDIVIAAPGIPKPVFQDDRLHVSDFEIQNNGDLLLLTYPKRLKKGSELILYDGQQILKNFQVPGIAEELMRDYRGNPHVLCKDAVYGIYATEERIGIAPLEKEYYMTYLAPIVDTNKTRIYFTTFNPDYPAFDYYTLDQLDTVYKKIMNIEDELMMELYRSEYKWADIRTKLWAKEQRNSNGGGCRDLGWSKLLYTIYLL